MEIKNAKIKSTMLGKEDHGIMSFMLYLDYGGSGQGFGGYSLGGNSYKIIKRILEVVGVNSWEDLKGQVVRVKAEHNKVHSIGNFLEDDWLNPKEFFDEIKRVDNDE